MLTHEEKLEYWKEQTDHARTQRDKLLAACEELLKYAEQANTEQHASLEGSVSSETWSDLYMAQNKAKAAIAAAKGE
jgi:hypothetical protein